MLIVCNGAYKSGSTWLFNIVRALGGFASPDPRFLNPRWKNPSIAPERLHAFLEQTDPEQRDYLVKQHFFTRRERDLLYAAPGVKVLDIERDLRDMVVSAYHHHVRATRFVGAFKDFYWIEGRMIVDHVCRYHRFWRGPDDKVMCVSYERLQRDFAAEVTRIARFVGRDLPPEQLAEVRAATTLRALRQRYGEGAGAQAGGFFRKGQVGDWERHFQADMLADLERVTKDGLMPHERAICQIRTKLHRLVRALPARRRAARRVSASRISSNA
jgi:hypothetical protein